MFRVDDPRSEPRVLHELTQNKMAEEAESDIAIATERFLLKLCQRNGNEKRIALPLLYRANSTAGKILNTLNILSGQEPIIAQDHL